MQKAYRIPDNDCACTEPGKAADKTVPINHRPDPGAAIEGDAAKGRAPGLHLRPVGQVGQEGGVKHLESIRVLDKPFDGFWMQKAYRIPDNDCACTESRPPPT
jgi:hypothetical protein